jgi:hypothetical protein
MNENPSPDSGSVSPRCAPTEPLPAHALPAGLAWAGAVAVGGGLICGLLLVEFHMLGYLGLMVIGVLAGAVSRRISGRAVPLLGYALAAAVLVALVVGQVYLIRFGFKDVETWGQALAKWPEIITARSFRMSNVLGLVSAGLGAHSAYWRAGKRFHRVVVMDE